MVVIVRFAVAWRQSHHHIPCCDQFFRLRYWLQLADDGGALRFIANPTQHAIALITGLTGKEKLGGKAALLPGERDGKVIVPRPPRIETRLDRAETIPSIRGGFEFAVPLEIRIAGGVVRTA